MTPVELETETHVIRALVADDQAVVRTGFVNLLNTQEDIDVVGEAEDGVQAVRIAAETRPDLALLDIRMPHKNGIDAAREILAASEGATKVLMLTTFGLDEYVYDALAAGAGGFLLKDATFPELLHAVRVVAGGNALLSPEITKRLIAEFVHARASRLPVPPARRPHGAGDAGADPDRPRAVQRGDRGPPHHHRPHREDPHQPPLHQAPAARPGAGRDRGLRDGAGPGGR